MDSASRFYSETTSVKSRLEGLRREASEQRVLRELKPAGRWRALLAAALHRLAERLEPRASTEGNLL